MLNSIRSALCDAPFDAVVLTSEVNRRYATGFHSTAGACYLSQKHAYFFTDFRYIEAARAQIHGFDVREIESGKTYTETINACIEADGVKTVALEEDSLSYADFRRWRRGLHAEAVQLEGMLDRLRTIKTPAEVEKIVSAQRIAEAALTETLNSIRVGVSEKRIAAELTYQMLLRGAENMSFDPIVVSGANSSKPHGVPTDKLLEAGDFVTMDFGCIYDGYCSDMTRTVAIRNATDEMAHVYDTVLRAQQAGIAVAKAGVTGSAIDSAARTLIEHAGYGDAFGHGFGHGVGLHIHESPNASPRASAPLPAGAILTAEPGIYLPGQFGVRIEDMLLLEEGGCRDLTNAPKELLILP
ncbi:MAG: aminopeptidase P family protein [Clostridia bacterium]|nr:aminopeptidase P family protein [Clostridia bacterium]